MRSTLQLDSIKTLLKAQYGVPDGILDQLDNLYRLSYKEGYDDASETDSEDE